MKEVILEYKVQVVVPLDIPDYMLTPDEIEEAIEKLQIENAPDGNFETIDDDYEWWGDREPKPKGCEPVPTDRHWVEIDGQKWATNGWCMVTPECPPINEGNFSNPWYEEDSNGVVKKALVEWFAQHKTPSKKHCGYFAKQFLPLKDLAGSIVCGSGDRDPGFCFVGDRLIAIVMPVKVTDPSIIKERELFRFND